MTQQSYHHVLYEFRVDIFQRLTIIIAVFCIVMGFALVFMEPLPHPLILTLQLFGVLVFYIRYIAGNYPTTARYGFVISLYMLLAAGMLLLPVSWMPFIIAPILFVSELLVSRASIIAGVIFLGFTGLLVQVGYADYPVQAFMLFMLFASVLFHSSLRTIWTLLHWYYAMFGRNNALLEETRARRAELLQTLKSLEIARETQQRLQAQLVYARQQAEEARQMKERFASNISHELRTPLNIILGFTEIMHLTPEVYGRVDFPPRLQQDIYQIHRNSRHLLDMIDDVLDLSHIELSQFSLNFERVNLSEFLHDTVDLVANLFQNKPVDFSVSIAENLPEIQIDRIRIRQVIINLLNNAQRFTSQGSVTFCVYADEANVVFQVTDTGVGIPQDQLQLIFEEFFQVDYSLSRSTGGAGLGLPITRRFIEAHYGRLYVESEVGRGSTFTFTLPVPNAAPQSVIPLRIPEEMPREILWLVVDADSQVSKLIMRHLPECTIIQVDGLDEIDIAIARYSPQGIIYNTSLEPTLPDQLANLPMPVVMCSLPSTTQMVRRLGVEGCLSKPVLPHELTDRLQTYPQVNTLLVVDDDIGVVQLVQRTLENSHPQVTIRRAYSGQQAVEMMQAAAPDLVLLDLAMPGMSGFEVISAMKADPKLQDIPIILLTATRYVHAEDEMRDSLQIHRQDGLKPMEVLKLLNCIAQTVGV